MIFGIVSFIFFLIYFCYYSYDLFPSTNFGVCCSLLVVLSSVQSLSHVWLFATSWTSAHQAFLSISNSWRLLKLMSIQLVMPSRLLILMSPSPPAFNLPQDQGFFSKESVLCIRRQKYSASASVLPMNIQDQFPLGSPCTPRASQECLPTPQIKSISSLVLSFLYSPTFTSIHDYWKCHSFGRPLWAKKCLCF